MKTLRVYLFLLLVSCAVFAQRRISIPAGTPEDKALTEISQEGDTEKRVKLLEDFVQKYSSNPAAVAYGNWQLSQQFVGSDPNKALGYGDKALAAMPDVLDILQSQTDLAQQAKNYEKVVDYATRGAVVIGNIEKQAKPGTADEASWKNDVAREKELAVPIYDYLSTAAYNAMTAETDPKRRMAEIEKFSETFAGSKLQENVNVLAVATFQELNEMPKLIAFGEKSLAKDPTNVSLLTLMANACAEDNKGDLAKADSYARKAIELAKSDSKMTADSRLITEGFAHEILGYSLLKQDKTAAAIAEFKTASTMLKSDSMKYSLTLFRLGYAYGKANQVANAKQTLAEAAAIDGPFQDAAKDLLAKLNAPRPTKK